MSHMFHLHKRLRPNSRIMYRFSLPSTDDELTGPGYMNQLACEQKKTQHLAPNQKKSSERKAKDGHPHHQDWERSGGID